MLDRGESKKEKRFFVIFAVIVVVVGAVLLFWLILAKFFESRVDFTVKGVVLIFAGLLLTGLNIAFIRYKKARS